MEKIADDLADYKVDKSGFPPGPWHDEPDRVQWQHAGFACLIARSPSSGVLCGYVGIPEQHPWYEVPCSDVDLQVDVHGGLTYSNVCSGHICHVPEPGMPDKVWWFGFDCGHAWDYCPGFAQRLPELLSRGRSYKNIAFVRSEAESLAEQLARVQNANR